MFKFMFQVQCDLLFIFKSNDLHIKIPVYFWNKKRVEEIRKQLSFGFMAVVSLKVVIVNLYMDQIFYSLKTMLSFASNIDSEFSVS